MSTPRNDPRNDPRKDPRKPGRDIPREIEDQLALFFDNQASPEVCRAIHTWLEEDPAHAEVFADFAAIERMIYHCQRTQDASAIFALLQEAEDAAEVHPVILDENPLVFTKSQRSETSTLKQAVAVLGEVGLDAIRRHARVVIGLAAALLLGAVLYLSLFSGDRGPAPADDIAVQAPAAPQAAPARQVATLTAAHDAQWALPAPTIGQAIYAGQSLTLTHGQAQLTTARGAQVTLIGPCTIALTDNDNALYLNAGRLFGVVPPVARGFIVQTPTARVVDIGTEFGIEIDNQTRQTRVQVYQGEVTAAPLKADGQPETYRSITTGQARTLDRAGVHLVAFNPQWIDKGLRLTRLRPTVMGGMAKWSATMPDDLRQGAQVFNGLQVYLEAQGMMLDQPVRVDLIAERRAWPTTPAFLEPLPVAQGERVDIYLLHMDQTGIDKSSPVYTLDFGRPILGVIARQMTLVETDRLIDPDGQRRYIDAVGELRAVETQDSVRIGDDGQSIQVQLNVDHKIDQIRVLVRAAEEPSNVDRP